MATFPNQFIITFAPAPKTDANNPYHKINMDALQNAMNDLKKMGSLKMWMYLTTHSDTKSFGLSKKACEDWGIKKDAYYAAQEELEQKGYLKKLGNDRYEFSQVPVVMHTTTTPVQKWDYSDF